VILGTGLDVLGKRYLYPLPGFEPRFVQGVA